MKDADCIAFLQWALPQLSLRWAGFRKVRRQVCKRLGRRLQRLGLDNLEDYRARLASDPQEWAALDDLCRITISRFYRDKGVFRTLSGVVLPILARRSSSEKRDVACWSAGCASGEEVYTLRIIWDALVAPVSRIVGLSVIGTDIDSVTLERARVGCYPRGTLREMPDTLIDSHFDIKGDQFCVKQKHRRGITFAKQDIRMAMPPGPFDLVLCRNLVLTYFEPELQRRVLTNMTARLRPGGFLVIGAHESLPEGITGYAPLPGCRQILRLGAPAE